MGLKFSRFIRKIETEVVVARDGFQVEAADRGKLSEEFVKKSAVLYVTEDFGRKNALREGEVVKVTRGGRNVNLRVVYSDTAPAEGAMMPNSIYANYLADFDSFKRFRVSIEIADGSVTAPSEIIELIKSG